MLSLASGRESSGISCPCSDAKFMYYSISSLPEGSFSPVMFWNCSACWETRCSLSLYEYHTGLPMKLPLAIFKAQFLCLIPTGQIPNPDIKRYMEGGKTDMYFCGLSHFSPVNCWCNHADGKNAVPTALFFISILELTGILYYLWKTADWI